MNTPQQVYVQAFNVGNTSNSVNSSVVYTLAVPPTATAITSVFISSISISWQANNNPAGTIFIAEKSADNVSFVELSSGANLSAIAFGLLPDATYYFRVKAQNGNSIATDYDLTISTKTLPDTTPPLGAPTTPADSGVFSASSNLTFSWLQGSSTDAESGIAGFYFQAGTSPGLGNLFDGDAGNVLTKTVSGAVEGQAYYARVRAKNGAGLYGDWSGNSDGITVDLTPPAAPTAITSASHPDPTKEYPVATPVFAVSGPSGDLSGIAGYYWKIDATSGTVPTSADAFAASGTAITSGLLADGTWYFHVVAKDVAGNVGTSATHYQFTVKTSVNPAEQNVFVSVEGVRVEIPAGAVSATTQIIIQAPATTPPAPPSAPNFRATPVVRDIKLADGTRNFQKEIIVTLPYTANDAAGLDESSLRLFFYDDSGGYWALIGNSTADTTNKTVTGRVTHFTLFRIMEYTPAGGAVSDLSNYPNPFAPLKGQTTRIRYSLQAESEVRVRIFDPFGGLVWERTVSAGSSGARAGPNEISWDGKAGDGHWAAAGGYICLVETSGEKAKTKIGVK
ncbi:MAG: hypothetical protein HY747_02445 [Elusimicrobia bacterium]|nr:hypothetical protein [Elusimicrobiota bacterium]